MKKQTIEVKWIYDNSDFGGSVRGAKAYLDGELILNKTPDSRTYLSFPEEEIVHELLFKLGYNVITSEKCTFNGKDLTYDDESKEGSFN